MADSAEEDGHMDGGKKRLREDQDEDSCHGAKQARLDGFGPLDLQTKEKSGTSTEFCDSFSSEYSILLKDPWSCMVEDQVTGSGIRSTAIRKHFMDNRCESAIKESSFVGDSTEATGRGFCFEAVEDELWRPTSPLSGIEALFSLETQDFSADDSANLKEDCFLPWASSGFRIWEGEEERGGIAKEEKSEAIRFLHDREVSDWILRAPLDQPLLPESFEFEISMPNV